MFRVATFYWKFKEEKKISFGKKIDKENQKQKLNKNKNKKEKKKEKEKKKDEKDKIKNIFLENYCSTLLIFFNQL